MKRTIALCAASVVCGSLATVATMRAALPTTTRLENARVKISEVVCLPGVPRERSIRATDQIIVFLDDSRYRRTDSDTGEKTIRERKSGDVIWHNKGEDAPVLENLGAKPYRTLVIELK